MIAQNRRALQDSRSVDQLAQWIAKDFNELTIFRVSSIRGVFWLKRVIKMIFRFNINFFNSFCEKRVIL